MLSDHRLLWIELDNSSLLGKHLPSVVPVKACRIRCEDPRSRTLYVRRVVSAMSSSGLLKDFQSLYNLSQIYTDASPSEQPGLLPPLKRAYDSFHSALDHLRLSTERELRPNFSGAQAWSPRLQRYRDTIEYWRRVVRLKQGVAASRCALRRLRLRLRLPSDVIDLSYAVSQLKAAYRDYRVEARPQALAWRLEHNMGFKEALIAEGKPGNSSVRAIERRMARKRRQVLLGKASRRITGRGCKHAIFQAERTGTDGSRTELHDQPSMVAAMAASNLSRQ